MKLVSQIWLCAVALSVLGLGVSVSPKSVAAPQGKKLKGHKRVVDFNRDVRPILSEHCYACHGPAARLGKADLRLDQLASVTKDRGGEVAIKPGDSKHSLVMDFVATTDERDQMPPKNSGKLRLTPQQIETIGLWIDQGAKYQPHWAYVVPKMPAIPAVAKPNWVRNSIDAFVLSSLEANKLAPAPEAPPETLLRRASLTLTGLVPSPEELAAFSADRQPGAYERAVDRLLESPLYGEHQARFWLDAVRYGDTHGLHLDNERAIYPYRDWIVRQYNQDLPFEKFIKWQLAGDMMPNPTREMQIATGYIRMNPTTNEGGAIESEFLAKNTFDRVDTTSTVFLGLTVACARCHDHKYDAISQKEYYEMFAYFNSTTDAPFDGNELTPGPVLPAPTSRQSAEETSLLKQRDAMRQAVSTESAEHWLGTLRLTLPTVTSWEVSKVYAAKSFNEAFDTQFDAETTGATAEWKPLVYKLNDVVTSINRENASIYYRANLEVSEGLLFEISVASDDGISLWLDGKQIHRNPALRGVAQATDSVKVRVEAGKHQLLAKVTNAGGPDGFKIGWGSAASVAAANLKLMKGKPEYANALSETFLTLGPRTGAAINYAKLTAALRSLQAQIPSTLIAKELPMPRPAYILTRGEYNLPGEKVGRGIPKALGMLPKGATNDRLGLGEWLASENNPIVTRVFVNRIWQQHFGTGIVKTAEDFGNQGEWPSHPELLDFLAVDFRKSGGSLKHLHRMILRSSAFRQSSVLTAEKRLKDPENRLISRGPRFRLDAEVIRDQALQVSGLLLSKQGGVGFRPYQPDGLWEAVGFSVSTTGAYKQDVTEAIYRRSLYLFWKRTSPHPIVMAFDAPMRETCVVRRGRTNTPLQALVTMNEPAFFECARHLGQRIMLAKSNDEDCISFAFRCVLGRNGSAPELSIIRNALASYRKEYDANPIAAADLLKVGMTPPIAKLNSSELASWTMIGNTLLNLDEFLTQH